MATFFVCLFVFIFLNQAHRHYFHLQIFFSYLHYINDFKKIQAKFRKTKKQSSIHSKSYVCFLNLTKNLIIIFEEDTNQLNFKNEK